MAKKETTVTRTPVKLDPPQQVNKMIQLDHGNAPLYTAKFLETLIFELRELKEAFKAYAARK
jgi:hypothetical protein